MRALFVPAFLTLCFLICPPAAFAQNPGGVPSNYAKAYNDLKKHLDNFESLMNRSWDGSYSHAFLAASLLPANANKGDELLSPKSLQATRIWVTQMKKMGLKAVSLDINFPVMSPEYYSFIGQTPETADLYEKYYASVAEEARRQGLKVIVETTQIFTDGIYSKAPVKPFYESLSFEDYQTLSIKMMKRVALAVRPDFYSISNEPDTMAQQTGKPFNGPVFLDFTNKAVENLRSLNIEGMKIGSGMGTWYKDFDKLLLALATESDVDYIDVHIYPVQANLLTRAAYAASVARKNGKGIAIGEAWLYKIANGEGLRKKYSEIYDRDPFSFWAPLDIQLIEVLAKLAHIHKFEFVSFFWSQYLFGYAEHSAFLESGGKARVSAAVAKEMMKNMATNQFSPAGQAIKTISSRTGTPTYHDPATPAEPSLPRPRWQRMAE